MLLALLSVLRLAAAPAAEPAPPADGAPDELATDPAGVDDTAVQHDHEAPRPHGWVGLGVHLEGGIADTTGAGTGYEGRLEYRMLLLSKPGTWRAYGGMSGGFGGYSTEGGWGIDLPTGVILGWLGPISGEAIFGGNALALDRIDDDTGVGLLAPFAGASLGVKIGDVEVAATARATYRWQLGADDRGQLTLGLRVGSTQTGP